MFSLVLFQLLLLTNVAEAHQPVLVAPDTVGDVISIDRPEVSWAYYGELQGFPHTYEIRSEESFLLYTQILEPDIDGAMNNHDVIVVRERDNGRGVEEVVRFYAKDTDWQSFHEPFGNDAYLAGGEYEAEVEPGVYRIEVSTPRNEGKYVLSVGKIEDFSDVSYFETVKRIYQVKLFFEKPGIAVVLSPFVYVPLIIILLIMGIFYYFYRRRHA